MKHNHPDNSHKNISRLLSRALRHAPESLGLTMDANGWVGTAELIKNVNTLARIPLDHSLLVHLVETNDKQRFALSPDGKKIRANQGHSIAVDLALEEAVPPELLYHGTATRFLDSIARQGLRPMGRQFVHLSLTVETAVLVGKRHGKPVVLRIDAKAMAAESFPFYLSENKVWLTPSVPPRFILPASPSPAVP